LLSLASHREFCAGTSRDAMRRHALFDALTRVQG
jgi:hypothetical protein